MRQWREQEQAQQLQHQIEEFSKGAEFFNDVREQMAALLDAGTAKDLKDAYEQAIWINPEVREVMLQRQEAAKQKSAASQRRAKATAASVDGGDAAGVDVAPEAEDDSTAAIIREQFAAAQSGRV